MSDVPFQEQVADSVPKINNEVAVGEDLNFQRRWWKFEGVMWWLIAGMLLLNFAGAFGRGPRAHVRIRGDAMVVKYDRVERTGTPSILVVQLQPQVFGDRTVKLHVSQSLVEELGTQRVIPSPSDTAIGNGGLTYTFSTQTRPPGFVEFALQPAKPGIYHFSLQVAEYPPINARVIVVP